MMVLPVETYASNAPKRRSPPDGASPSSRCGLRGVRPPTRRCPSSELHDRSPLQCAPVEECLKVTCVHFSTLSSDHKSEGKRKNFTFPEYAINCYVISDTAYLIRSFIGSFREPSWLRRPTGTSRMLPPKIDRQDDFRQGTWDFQEASTYER